MVSTLTGYTYSDVVRLSGSTPSNLKWWTNKNLIRADVADTAGTGHHRRFSFLNLVEAAIAFELNQYGISVDGMRQMLDAVRFLAFTGTPGRLDPAQASLADFRDMLRDRIAANSYIQDDAARLLGTTSADETIANLMVWRTLIDRRFRGVLRFCGLFFTATGRYGFYGELKNDPAREWSAFGRSVLFVNLIPILEHLEDSTNESLVDFRGPTLNDVAPEIAKELADYRDEQQARQAVIDARLQLLARAKKDRVQ
jgi:DNA-binding transcriptional MerR regulator